MKNKKMFVVLLAGLLALAISTPATAWEGSYTATIPATYVDYCWWGYPSTPYAVYINNELQAAGTAYSGSSSWIYLKYNVPFSVNASTANLTISLNYDGAGWANVTTSLPEAGTVNGTYSLETRVIEESESYDRYMRGSATTTGGNGSGDPGEEEDPTPWETTEGYWTLSIDDTTVNLNEDITATLTETDPDDNYDLIEYWIDYPTSTGFQYVKYLTFVYDPGFFGLGAGWKKVYPGNNTAVDSSLEEAMEQEITFTTAGIHDLAVTIEDDVALLPLITGHDYKLIADLHAAISVTQGSNMVTVYIQPYDPLNNAAIAGATVTLTDLSTNQDYTDTNTGGGSCSFVVPNGHDMLITGSLSGYSTYDSYTSELPGGTAAWYISASSPGAFQYYFYPLSTPDAGLFNYVARVYDRSTMASISGAQVSSSLGNVTLSNSAGTATFQLPYDTSVYVTASKPGYQSLTQHVNHSSLGADTWNQNFYLYPATVTTTPTTIPGWTATPTGGATSTPIRTLDTRSRAEKVDSAIGTWYDGAEMLSSLFFMAVVIGVIFLIRDGATGRRRGGRWRK